jgi:D-alanyl-D-alanine carboxypeptidase
MATLGRRLFTDFPNRYHYFGTVHFAWGRAQIRNHNRMLGDYDGADGIKTGFINASGFNIVTSAQRDGVRLVGATFGGSSWVERDRHMGALLDQGFARMGVAPRAPSSVMTAAAPAPRRNPPAARPVAQGNARSAQAAAQQRPRPQQQVVSAPNRLGQLQVPVRQTQAATPRPAARPVQRVEQGSAASSSQRANTQRPNQQRTQATSTAPRQAQR